MASGKFPQNWKLDNLLPHPESDGFRSAYDRYEKETREIAERSERLPPIDSDATHLRQWGDFIKEFTDVDARGTDLRAHISCHSAAEAENKEFQRWDAKLSALDPLRSKILTNLEFALKVVNPETFEKWVTSDPRLNEVRFFWEECRRNAKFRLPKPEEELFAELGVDGIHAWGRMYDRISGDLRIELMEKGELVKKSPGQIRLDVPERSARQNSFFAMDKAWNTLADHCADALNHLSGVRLTRYRRLGLTDHLDAPLRYNRLRRETLGTMWQTVTDRKSMLLSYLKKKAELLGIDRLTWYDLQAPLPKPGKPEPELSYDAACNQVIETFQRFSPEFGDFARMAMEKQWIEAEDRSGKRQGAFCTGYPAQKVSRIFMTFTRSTDAMSTLAHELGHAYHSWVLKDQPLLLQDYPMNLAETASTFAEAVLGEARLAMANNPHDRLIILDEMLADAVAYLMNIHARFVFEDHFHRERAQGELSAIRISELMLAAQKETYLNALADDGWYPGFWISKLHFYISSLPFYNFPYTFGYLLSLGTYAVARGGEKDFPNKYKRMLIATGNQETEPAVSSTLGYDLTRPDFWNRSLDVVEERARAFVKLADELM